MAKEPLSVCHGWPESAVPGVDALGQLTQRGGQEGDQAAGQRADAPGDEQDRQQEEQRVIQLGSLNVDENPDQAGGHDAQRRQTSGSHALQTPQPPGRQTAPSYSVG